MAKELAFANALREMLLSSRVKAIRKADGAAK